MSWNTNELLRTVCIQVSLLVRLWVEMGILSGWLVMESRQPPREAVSWNITKHSIDSVTTCQPPREAVSWNAKGVADSAMAVVSLLVRLWVEITSQQPFFSYAFCQPPREAVSWNVYSFCIDTSQQRQPPREAVSWNFILVKNETAIFCQPPREAVSWNISDCVMLTVHNRQPPREAVSWNVKFLLQFF